MSPGSRLRVGAIAVLAVWACDRGTARPERARLHGAATMEEQQRVIDRLGAGVSGRIDPRVWQSRIPADNQPGVERVALGRALFFDLRLSADGTVACATCHDITRAMTDRRPTAEGIGNKLGRRNTPTTMNAALLGSLFRDGRAASLEEQALLPIVNPIEMGQPSGEAAVRAIAGDPRYQKLFHDAYGRPPNYADIGRALASFERTLVFLDAPFERFLRGERGAISAAAERGWEIFNGKARCAICHPLDASSPLGTDESFHNTGVSARHQDLDSLVVGALDALERDGSAAMVDELALVNVASGLGRFLVSRDFSDVGAFRTPQLRNVGVTAPYMHDGSLATLWDVLDHYDRGGEANRFLDGDIEPLGLTDEEMDDLVELLFAMTDLRFAADNLSERTRQKRIAGLRPRFRDDPTVGMRREIGSQVPLVMLSPDMPERELGAADIFAPR